MIFWRVYKPNFNLKIGGKQLPKIKKMYDVRYIITDVVSIPVYRAYSKGETYRAAVKDGWGTVYYDGNYLVCDDDCSADLYTKEGGYFSIYPYEIIDPKSIPKQSECESIVIGDSCGFTIWAKDMENIHIFVTYSETGKIDTYRIDRDQRLYDGEFEISFYDLSDSQ